ncbi:CAP domain-containing protein [bacterium]|nr:CAP domain-containing protein [bacterium]
MGKINCANAGAGRVELARRQGRRAWLWLLPVLLLGSLSLVSCGGGASLPDVWDDELPPIGNPGGGKGTVYTPPVTVPAQESYSDQAPSGASAAQRWVSNSYATLPPGALVFQNSSLEAWADAIVSGVNAQRQKAGLPALAHNTQLERLGQAHARDMALRDYFSHTSLEGLEPWERLSALNPPAYDHAGESNAKGQESASEVVNGWMTSPGHREIILNPLYTHIGVGVYYDPSDRNLPIHVAAELVEFVADPGGSWGL